MIVIMTGRSGKGDVYVSLKCRKGEPRTSQMEVSEMEREGERQAGRVSIKNYKEKRSRIDGDLGSCCHRRHSSGKQV
eukprot:c38720_g1_i1 orf=181-411(+)